MENIALTMILIGAKRGFVFFPQVHFYLKGHPKECESSDPRSVAVQQEKQLKSFPRFWELGECSLRLAPQAESAL